MEDDPRFGHVASDPKFRLMPKSKRKVNIDSRFQSVFTGKHFSHRTDVDKRGRPIIDTNRQGKHVMQRFYQLSDQQVDEHHPEVGDSVGKHHKQTVNKSLLGRVADENECIIKKHGSRKDKHAPATDKACHVTHKTGDDTTAVKARVSDKAVHATVRTDKASRGADKTGLAVNKPGRTVDKPDRGGMVGYKQTKDNSKCRRELKTNGVRREQTQQPDQELQDSHENDMSYDTGLDNVVHDDEDSATNSSDDEESDDDGEESDDDGEESDDDDELPEFSQEYVLEETEVDHKWNELQEDAPAVVDSTHRLAVCNMDWDFVKAQDLFVLFKSFVPDGGCIKSVSIYPSEFGKARMAEEARLGPREMREQKNDDTLSPGPEKGHRKNKKVTVDQQKVKRSTKQLEASNTEKLREYQLNRLRYFFAVVDCDSSRTAETIYNECDGREYLLSSVRLDLRFVPDNMTFDDLATDICSQENSILDYQPSRFSSTALCQAKVDITWDETDRDRLTRQMANLQQKELESIVEENKYADIIAPPESDSDEDVLDQPDWLKQSLQGSDGDLVVTEEEKIALYRKLLMDQTQEGEEGDSEEDGAEFVWQPGLKSSLVKKMQKKEKKAADTGVVSEYLEKKREKKRKKKEGKKKKTDEVQTVDDIDVAKGNSGHRNVSQAKKRKRQQSASVDTNNEVGTSGRAGLELLVMGENDDVKEENKEDAGTSKKKRRKSKKKKLIEGDVVDVSDTRFTALYTSHHFHIDPTSSKFKKTKSMSALVDEQVRRRGGKAEPVSGSVQGTSSKSLSHSLVESLKSKMRK